MTIFHYIRYQVLKYKIKTNSACWDQIVRTTILLYKATYLNGVTMSLYQEKFSCYSSISLQFSFNGRKGRIYFQSELRFIIKERNFIRIGLLAQALKTKNPSSLLLNNDPRAFLIKRVQEYLEASYEEAKAYNHRRYTQMLPAQKWVGTELINSYLHQLRRLSCRPISVLAVRF